MSTNEAFEKWWEREGSDMAASDVQNTCQVAWENGEYVEKHRDKWIAWPETHPPAGEDFGCFRHSEDVLFTDGKKIWTGYLQTWDDEEYEARWFMSGPDGWTVDNVAHWMPLPELPATEGGK